MTLSPALRVITCLLYFVGMEYVTIGGVGPLMVNKSSRFEFSTCNNRGPQGPTQAQCDAAYADNHVKVTVSEHGNLSGVQQWIVPETHAYSILALGAAGGQGLAVKKVACGTYIYGIFNLTKGEVLYILVGQEGESLCNKVNPSSQLSHLCIHDLQSAGSHPGGGGGGGGTFVFRRNETTGELFPLVVAGGGGGMPSIKLETSVPYTSEGRLKPSGSGRNGHASQPDAAGAGGGWRGQSMSEQDAFSVALGGQGGNPCTLDNEGSQWYAHGGFGGGGGACYGGGGGGGYTGGNATEHQGGQGGSSFISRKALVNSSYPRLTCELRDGMVEIVYYKDCPCRGKSWCIYEENKKVCICPDNLQLAPGGLHCIDPAVSNLEEVGLSNSVMIAMITGLLVVLVMFGICVFCVVQRKCYNRKAGRLDRLSNADYQLDRLRSTVGGANVLTEYNPNYDFGGSKCTLQDLREIPRDHLTLVKALGQGAFGEVYMGYLANVPREPSDLPVAVKTLPALCTDQAEMDFLMEALIMSKFDHPNIVRFIGVCFEKHPRFIVLELLEGGDLKTYLRESRPKPDQPSPMTMLDLLKLATDIAQGCHYLEENHFIHRDIAARNCLLTKKGPGKIAKIADFGMARDIYRADYYRKGGKAMLPVKWMPPEAFLDGIFTSKTDVWSFGILLWEVFSLGYMPYPGRGNQEVMQLVTAGGRLEPPQNCPLCIYRVMNLCWHGIPERRPSFTDIIQHLSSCAQDMSVICSPLPVFHRPPSLEKESTVMRPRESDQTILTVKQPSCLTPDSMSSTKPLIGPQSPDLTPLEKQANLSGSAESLDQLLMGNGQECFSPHHVRGNAFSYQRVKDDDNSYYLSPIGCTHTHCDSNKDSKTMPCRQSGVEQRPVWVSAQVHKQASESDIEVAAPHDHCMSGDSGQSSIGSCSQHSLSHCSVTSQPGGSTPQASTTMCSSHHTPATPRPTSSSLPHVGSLTPSCSTHHGSQCGSQSSLQSTDKRPLPWQRQTDVNKTLLSAAQDGTGNPVNSGTKGCSHTPEQPRKNTYENIPLLPQQQHNDSDHADSAPCESASGRPRSGQSRQSDEGCDSGVVVDISRRDPKSQTNGKKDCTWL